MEINGEVQLGAIKIHISKGNKFDYDQQKSVATTIYQYLSNVVAKENEIVNPKLCLSLDIFGNGMVSTPVNPNSALNRIVDTCEEIKKIWLIV